MSGEGNSWTANVDSGDSIVDGLLLTNKWTGGAISYFFTISAFNYQAGYYTRPDDDDGLSAPLDNFHMINTAQGTAIDFALSDFYGPDASDGFSVAGFTNLDVNYGLNGGNANLRFGNSDDPGTAYAFGPGGYDEAGDVWFGDNLDGTVNSLKTPQAGNYAWLTILHEIGHALGLEHAHEGVVVPAFFDRIEYTVMSYRAYQGAALTGYTFETWGAPQTFMMYDIAALQHMYGADYTANSGDTIYKWDPSSNDTLINGLAGIVPDGDRIFATIWDGNGVDTYDLSAYTTGVNVNLAPGSSSVFSTTQLANLGDGNFAQGNIYNALLYQGNLGSLIENTVGGSAGDTLTGNQGNNALFGGGGYDLLTGLAGNDWLSGGIEGASMSGGTGADWFVITFLSQPHLVQDYNFSEGDAVYITDDGNVFSWVLSGDNLIIDAVTITNTGNADIRIILDNNATLVGQSYNALMGDLMQNGISGAVAAFAGSYVDIIVDADDNANWFVRGLEYNSADQLVADTLIYDDNTGRIIAYDLNPASGIDRTVTNYNSMQQILTQEQFNTDGSRVVTINDAAGTQPYDFVQNTYNPAGQQTLSLIVYDDGTTKTTFFDPTNAAAWTYVIQDQNGLGQLTRTDQINDDGTRVVTIYDAPNTQDYANVIFTYNAGGQVTKSDIIYDDGTRKTTVYDPADVQSYTTVVQSFNALGENTKTDAIFDDGTRIVTTYDPTDLYSYNYAINNYDSSGNLAAVNLYLDDGTSKETLFDATNSQLYSVRISDFNASNQLVKLTTVNDDSTRFETSYDHGVAPWDFSTKVFDAASQLDTIYTKNDDGTAVFIDYDQDNAFSWSLRYVTFDASGNILTDDYVI